MSLFEQLELFSESSAALVAPSKLLAPTKPVAGIAVVPTLRPPSLAAGTRWREVRASTQTIGFVLQRSRRKSIGLTINDDGLLITAPSWVGLGQIDDVVIEKSRWILDKLSVSQARKAQMAMAHTRWQDGGDIPYLGRRIILKLGETQDPTRFLGSAFAPTNGDTLHLALPLTAEHGRIRDIVHAWLQHQAQIWFELRLQHFLAISQLQIKRWRLSSAATRWGSCNSDGNIMLNWRLIHFERDIIDYVVVHEIAHLREMNHSKNFWREVGRILPGFEHARNILRQQDPACLPLI
ncbi:MAG: M48 family peptidase [Candidimonas sp.]|nr:MAG: M48 family peptidase [Candidimonas sp.]TAM20763.1 MAG: M48 family peptidase [Candidimonas sp.]